VLVENVQRLARAVVNADDAAAGLLGSPEERLGAAAVVTRDALTSI
jgi:hypothetical protein